MSRSSPPPTPMDDGDPPDVFAERRAELDSAAGRIEIGGGHGVRPRTTSGGTLVDGVEALRARRQVLHARLAAIRDDIGRGLDRDSGERAVELENAEVLDEIARVAEAELGDIDARVAEARSGAGA